MTLLAAPALVALVLAGVALPWILDAGTVHVPAIGVGVTTGSASGPPAVTKVVVTSPSKNAGTPQQHHSQPAPAPAAYTPTAKPSTGSSSQTGVHAPMSAAGGSSHQSHSGPTRTAAPPNPVIRTIPRSQVPTPATNPKADESSTTTSHPGRALGHFKHAFHGEAEQAKGPPPRGLALGHRNHVPPGQARKAGRPPRGPALGHRDHVPPGQARKQGGGEQGQNSQGDDNDEQGHGSPGQQGDTSPGQSDGSHGADSHGRGHGH
jgi:hypothetical protein